MKDKFHTRGCTNSEVSVKLYYTSFYVLHLQSLMFVIVYCFGNFDIFNADVFGPASRK